MESVRLDTPQGAPGMGKLSDHSSKVESMRERGIMQRTRLMSAMHAFVCCSLRCSFHSKILQVDSFFRPVVKNNDPPCITAL